MDSDTDSENVITRGTKHERSKSKPVLVEPSQKQMKSTLLIPKFIGPPTPLDICLPVIKLTDKNPHCEEDENIYNPSEVQKRVKIIVQRWGRVVPIDPEIFLLRILESRGYETEFVSAISQRKVPSPKQITDYDNSFLKAIRNSDLNLLIKLHAEGRSMSACNKYSESIVHMACRRSSSEIVSFLLEHEADFSIIDDFGRSPLHDAFWRPVPNYEIVALILDNHIDLLRYTDARGSIPLKYTREEHWVNWCAFLFNQIDKYWPSRKEKTFPSRDQIAHSNLIET